MAGYFDALNAYLPNQQDPLLQQIMRGQMASSDPTAAPPYDLKQIMTPVQAAQMQSIGQPKEVPAGVPRDLGAARWDHSLQLERESKELRDRLEQEINKARTQQQAGVVQYGKAIDDYAKKPTGIDFSPLAAYFDSNVEGSNLLKGYKAPESADMKQEKILAMQNQLQKAKEGVSDKDIEYMKTLLNAKLAGQALANGRDERQATALSLKKEDTLRRDFAGIGDKVAEASALMATLEENLASGDYQKISNSLSNFSRSVGGEKGVLTDQDIARVLPKNFQGSLARFESYFSSTPSAQIPPEYTKALVELTQTAKRRAAEKFQNEINVRKKGYSHPTSSYRDIMPGVGSAIVGEAEAQVKAMGGPAAAAPATDQRARLEELRRKAQGG